MSKFKVPTKLTLRENENIKKQIDLIVVELKDKIAIEHNNVITYIQDKEKIVFDGNVHKYSYFVYELERSSLLKAQEYLNSLKKQFDTIDKIPIADLLVAGDFGWDEDYETKVESWENVQNLIIKELIHKEHINRLIEVIYQESNNLYHEFYIQIHDAMLSAGYEFADKTIRKIATNLEYNLKLYFNDDDIPKRDISGKVPLKVYTPSKFRKTPKSYK